MDVGAPGAYDVSIVTPLRADASFREACAAEPGLAAERRHTEKLVRQYGVRRTGVFLAPLVVEIGGRWHASVPPLVRRWARESYARSRAPGPDYACLLAARWAARLSALLILGKAAVHRAARCPIALEIGDDTSTQERRLSHLLPDGDCAYELMCLQLPRVLEEAFEAGGG